MPTSPTPPATSPNKFSSLSHRPIAVISLLLAILPLAACAQQSPGKHYDLIVYGATPAGITAAIAAARQQTSVLLIEPSPHIGGMVTGGLSRTDYGNPRYISGLALEFFNAADAAYHNPAKSKHPRDKWYSEPHVAEQVFHTMLSDAHVTLLTNQSLQSITCQSNRIQTLQTNLATYHAQLFIDATYEGDLMARAGVKYTVGRESRSAYAEPLAGFQPPALRLMPLAQLTTPGPKYVHGTPTQLPARDPAGQLLWGIKDTPWPPAGAGDNLSQSYNFRVIATRRPDLRIPFPKPLHYDPARYQLLLQLILKYPGIQFDKLVFPGAIPNGKFDLNASGLIVSTDHPGYNTDYPDGDPPTRRRIWQDHVDWVQGFFYFLANDPRIPTDLRDQIKPWGLCNDEFIENNHWPYALYVREARRMVGLYVMKQSDCQTDLTKPDSIAMGTFILDSHCVQRLVGPTGLALDEGNFDVPVKPYQIPYRSITPHPDQCQNLLVPVCLSATHVAYGSIRMEPQFMMLGQASGLAATLALRSHSPVQQINLPLLQQMLRQQTQILSPSDLK